MPSTNYGGFDAKRYLQHPDQKKSELGNYVGVGLCAIAVICMVVAWRFQHRPERHGPPAPPIIPAITQFITLNSPTGVYKILAPDGWKYSNHNMPGSDMNVELFMNKVAVVTVIDDGAATTQTINPQPSNSSDDDDAPAAPSATPQTQPLADQHEIARMAADALFGQIDDGAASEISTGLGPAYISQFTAPPNPRHHLFWVTRGYRETIVTDSRRMMVICACPDIDWNALQPGFWKIVSSADKAGG